MSPQDTPAARRSRLRGLQRALEPLSEWTSIPNAWTLPDDLFDNDDLVVRSAESILQRRYSGRTMDPDAMAFLKLEANVTYMLTRDDPGFVYGDCQHWPNRVAEYHVPNCNSYALMMHVAAPDEDPGCVCELNQFLDRELGRR